MKQLVLLMVAVAAGATSAAAQTAYTDAAKGQWAGVRDLIVGRDRCLDK